jgi:nucleotidyltransferase/DNA polymerase involved in DNA repair
MSQAPVGHIDADCFYVSAERVRYEHLVGVPAGVLGNQGACVIAKSYEMKKCGVGTGMPIWEALKVCPDGLYVKRDFRWYEVLSRLMLSIVKDYSRRVEYYSIDEFFFDATPPRGKTPQEYAELIRDRIWEMVRVPVTVGIARTRTLAKLISDTAKPFGARAVLDRESVRALLSALSVTEVTGIAGRRERRLLPWNIRTCLDLADADRRLVRGLLTATGEALWWELNGESVLPLHPNRPLHKVLSRGGSFGEATDKPAVIWAWLVRNLERLVAELEYHEVRAGRLAVWVGYRDGRAGEGRAGLEAPSDRFDVLLDAYRPCMRRAWIPRAAAQRMHLFAERLSPRGCSQRGLFNAPSDRAEAVAAMKRAINASFDRIVLRSAATLPLAAIYRDRANEYDICDVHGKMCF